MRLDTVDDVRDLLETHLDIRLEPWQVSTLEHLFGVHQPSAIQQAGRRRLPTRLTPEVCERGCGGRILWARTVAGPNGPGGKAMPLDPYVDPAGNVAVRAGHAGMLYARVLGKGEDHDDHEVRAMPHFATCRRY